MLIFTCGAFFFATHTTTYVCTLTSIRAKLWHRSFRISPLEAEKTIYAIITLVCQECVEKPLTHLERANECEPVGVCWKEVGRWRCKG